MTAPQRSNIAPRLSIRVSDRARKIPPVVFADTDLPDGLLDYLGEHLARGETHYTVRPGIPLLRSAIGRELRRHGGPLREADGVIVTHGEAEALFVTLLGLGFHAGTSIVVEGGCRHHRLLDHMRVEVLQPPHPAADSPLACYCELENMAESTQTLSNVKYPRIIALGGLLYGENPSSAALESVSEDFITIGHLDSLRGLDHFRMGFVSGPPEVVKRIQTWKQALSICSAAPSQRAALFSIEKKARS